MDCHYVEPTTVRPVEGGWEVDLQAGQHFLVSSRITEIIPYEDERIRRSQDQDFHVCVKKTTQQFLCVYVPEFGT